MTQTLLTDEAPTPFLDYPPTWAYAVALLLGLIPFSGLIAAPLLARRWPSTSWRWGLWCTVLSVVAVFVTYCTVEGLKVGAVETITNPALLFVVVGSCLLALVFARRAARRATER